MKIDQRACGKGKTTDYIYKLINKSKRFNHKLVIVAGSIALQEQYLIKSITYVLP